MQGPGDHLETFVAPLGPQVHQLDFGQGLGRDPAVEFKIAIFAFPGIIAGGHLGGGGDQDHGGARQLAPVEGHIPGLVEEAALLLVGGVVFFIHHHQPQAGQGGKDRGAGPHHNIHFSHHDAAPLIHPKGLGQAAVEQGDPGAEAPPEGLAHGVGQGDLRHQDQDLASPGQGMGGGAHINLGFAAGRDAVEEKRGELAPVNPGDDARQGLFLVGHQGEVGGILGKGKRRISLVGPEAGAVLEPDQAPGGQAPQAVAAAGEAGLKIFHRGGAGFLKVRQERLGFGAQTLEGRPPSGGLYREGPEFPARLGGGRPPRDDEAQRLPQGILIVIRHPAEQVHQLRAEPGYGVEDLPDVPERPGRGLAGRAQEISRYLAAAHRHPDQAAHLGRGRKARRRR